jgi:putative transposase
MASPHLQRGRYSQVGAYYAITTNSAQRHPLFVDDAAMAVTTVLADADRLGMEPQAWVVMPDHVHMVLHLSAGSLGSAIQAFKSLAARAVNTACGTCGPVWQAGYFDRCLRSETDLYRQARYVIENPLRRGLAQRIEEYPYWWCRWISRDDLAP